MKGRVKVGRHDRTVEPPAGTFCHRTLPSPASGPAISADYLTLCINPGHILFFGLPQHWAPLRKGLLIECAAPHHRWAQLCLHLAV